MAKLAVVLRDKNRRKTVEKFKAKRAQLFEIMHDSRASDEAKDEAGATVETPSENGAAGVAKKKTRRGSRGGKNRRKRTADAAAGSNGAESAETVSIETEPIEAVPVEAVSAEEPSTNGAPEEDWGYVPMSEWVDELDK